MKRYSRIGFMLILMTICGFLVCYGAERQDAVVLKLAYAENVHLKIGQTLRVELKANPTTGYIWTYEKTQNPHIIEQVGESEFIRDQHNPQAVGVGGTRIYRFEALEKGQATLVFKLNRPWEKGKGNPPLEKHVVRINVK